jgi:hypothetical protein
LSNIPQFRLRPLRALRFAIFRCKKQREELLSVLRGFSWRPWRLKALLSVSFIAASLLAFRISNPFVRSFYRIGALARRRKLLLPRGLRVLAAVLRCDVDSTSTGLAAMGCLRIRRGPPHNALRCIECALDPHPQN